MLSKSGSLMPPYLWSFIEVLPNKVCYFLFDFVYITRRTSLYLKTTVHLGNNVGDIKCSDDLFLGNESASFSLLTSFN
ncbi:hypothetical protein AC249_AIPGENE9397 [Exaiptasia diaphana]|nr:hypothetical protein AC249_AIPGENE9397 [Exaiptasia diaphana]